MSTLPQQSDRHPALSHRCPFCNADPGTPCVTRLGRETDPHSRRIRIVRHWPPTPVKQALCCQCGQQRTYLDQWRAQTALGDYNPNRQWDRRMVGGLKCSHCQAITPHALLHDPSSVVRDKDERRHRLALGDAPWPDEQHFDVDRLRREYRQSDLPRNPLLKHRYWVDEARAAWKQGERTVISLCGGPMTLNRDPDATPSQTPPNDLLAPSEIRDQDYEDPDTGLWWVEMDCVDCLRVSNTERLRKSRKALIEALREIACRAAAGELDAATTYRLLDGIKAAVGEHS